MGGFIPRVRINDAVYNLFGSDSNDDDMNNDTREHPVLIVTFVCVTNLKIYDFFLYSSLLPSQDFHIKLRISSELSICNKHLCALTFVYLCLSFVAIGFVFHPTTPPLHKQTLKTK